MARQGEVWKEVKSKMITYGRIQVRIKGLDPGILMNSPNLEKLKEKGGVRGKKHDQKKEARESAYIAVIDGKEQLFIPGYALYNMMIEAGKKYKYGRGSLSSVLPGTIMIEPAKIPLGHCEYEIDERLAKVPPRTGALVPRIRAKIPEWEATFTLIYNKTFLEAVVDQLKTVMEDGGIRIGILDYRPQHRGPFGRFTVEEWEIEGRNEA